MLYKGLFILSLSFLGLVVCTTTDIHDNTIDFDTMQDTCFVKVTAQTTFIEHDSLLMQTQTTNLPLSYQAP